MQPRTVFVSLAIALALVATPLAAPAQSSPAPSSAAPARPHIVAAKEDPKISAAAKAFYAQVREGKVDRSKLGPELSAAMNEDMTQLIGSQLTALGTPTWDYAGYVETPANGRAHVYNLTYPEASFRLLYGAKDGIVSIFALAPRQVPAKP